MNPLDIRKDFPALHKKMNGKPLVYLDNAATSQRLQEVIDVYTEASLEYNGNVHRSPHKLGQMATKALESTRDKVQELINAKNRHEIIFSRGTTESINLVAYSYGETYISAGDEIIVTEMEHHSNIVPWHMLCERKGAILKVLPFDDEGNLCIKALDDLLTERTKMLAITHISNVLGTINPLKEVITKAHSNGTHVLVDGAQSIVHQSIDVQDMNCDFFVFSAHKMYGPTGIGVLYGKEKILNEMQPYQGGSEMIEEVTFKKIKYRELPAKFEAGTPDFNSIAAFAPAVDYLKNINFTEIEEYETSLLQYAEKMLTNIEGIRFYGQAKDRASLLSFNIKGMHPFDTGTLLDKMGIAIRTGHMCADTVMTHFNINGMMRISFAPYNTINEIDQLYDALIYIKKMFL